MIRRGAVVTTMFMVAACASAPPPMARPAGDSAAEVRKERTLFDVRVGFWVHLHQRLFEESGRQPPPDALHATVAADQEAWDRALATYRQRYPKRGFMILHANAELRETNWRLSELENAPELATASLPSELRTALEMAAPVYRRNLWTSDEQASRAFRDRLVTLLMRHGEPMAKDVSRIYGTPWPTSPIRVDLAPFAGPTAAYTSLEPTHTTLASRDTRHEGDALLEIVFHEASHALVERIQQSIERAGKAQNKPISSDLWHAVLFYATGDVAQRQLGPGYTPYAQANGLYARSPSWAAAEPLLAQYWPRYVAGQQSLDTTIDQIVTALP